MNKRLVVTALIPSVEKLKRDSEQSLRETLATIADAPGPMQSHSDTTRYQKSILAGTVAQSVEDKENAIRALRELLEVQEDIFWETVSIGSVVLLENSSEDLELYMIISYGAGASATVGREIVTIITPASPIGSILMGRRRGEELTLTSDRLPRTLKIIDIF